MRVYKYRATPTAEYLIRYFSSDFGGTKVKPKKTFETKSHVTAKEKLQKTVLRVLISNVPLLTLHVQNTNLKTDFLSLTGKIPVSIQSRIRSCCVDSTLLSNNVSQNSCIQRAKGCYLWFKISERYSRQRVWARDCWRLTNSILIYATVDISDTVCKSKSCFRILDFFCKVNRRNSQAHQTTKQLNKSYKIIFWLWFNNCAYK